MVELNHTYLPEDFLPVGVSGILIHQDDDVLQSLKLHKSELEIANSFKNKHRRESFILGRKAALLALSKLGNQAPVLKGVSEEPVWPPDTVGSISHSGEFAICVVTKNSKIAGLGIDIEASRRTSLRIAKRICTKDELENLQGSKSEQLERLLSIFSAKEAYYKSIFPSYKRYLGFRDVELVWSGEEFVGRIVNPKFKSDEIASGKIFRGECLVSVCFKSTS